MSKKVLVPVADGTEELEAISIIDVLRRAGAEVTVASVGGLQITASRGTRIVADRLISDCLDEDWDLVALPGGMPGAEHLRDSGQLLRILKRQQAEDRYYGAICAAPAVVLQHHGLIGERRATCHPAFMGQLDPSRAVGETVVVDGPVATSRGAGTAVDFALKLVELLYGPDRVAEVKAGMVLV
ncbi:MAG: DJ-1/PfpI family protein [Proteobacteria bacterium]|nr:DJ-1/PfpI family protein [Pseudomonadota bacterium]